MIASDYEPAVIAGIAAIMACIGAWALRRADVAACVLLFFIFGFIAHIDILLAEHLK